MSEVLRGISVSAQTGIATPTKSHEGVKPALGSAKGSLYATGASREGADPHRPDPCRDGKKREENVG